MKAIMFEQLNRDLWQYKSKCIYHESLLSTKVKIETTDGQKVLTIREISPIRTVSSLLKLKGVTKDNLISYKIVEK